MFISLHSTIVTGRVSWPDLAELASQCGYSGVDVYLQGAMSAGVVATKDLLARLRLQASSNFFQVEFRKSDREFEETLPLLEPAAKFIAEMGCPRMATWVPASSDLSKAEQRAIYLRRFRQCAEILNRHHIRLGLEFLGPLHLRKARPYEFIWQMNEMLEFAHDCGPNFGLLLDSWHWHHSGATVEDIVSAGRQRIVHVHINDAAKQAPEEVRDNERLLPGEGVIDLDGFLKALQKIGYRDALSVEVFGRGLKDMAPDAAARLALASTQTVMRKAGVQ